MNLFTHDMSVLKRLRLFSSHHSDCIIAELQ